MPDELNKQLEGFFNTYLSDIISESDVKEQIETFFQKGLDKAELQFNMNFFVRPAKIDFLTAYTFDLIKGMTQDSVDLLRDELRRGIMNLDSVSKIKERVMNVLDKTDINARRIVRTETVRALNEGNYDGALQSELDLKKEWSAHLDKRTSTICRTLNGKQVGLKEKFKYKDKEFNLPPAHPNCRSRCIYVQI